MRLVKRRAKGGVQFSGRDGKRWAENESRRRAKFSFLLRTPYMTITPPHLWIADSQTNPEVDGSV